MGAIKSNFAILDGKNGVVVKKKRLPDYHFDLVLLFHIDIGQSLEHYFTSKGFKVLEKIL